MRLTLVFLLDFLGLKYIIFTIRLFFGFEIPSVVNLQHVRITIYTRFLQAPLIGGNCSEAGELKLGDIYKTLGLSQSTSLLKGGISVSEPISKSAKGEMPVSNYREGIKPGA